MVAALAVGVGEVQRAERRIDADERTGRDQEIVVDVVAVVPGVADLEQTADVDGKLPGEYRG